MQFEQETLEKHIDKIKKLLPYKWYDQKFFWTLMFSATKESILN